MGVDPWRMIHRGPGITHFGFGDFNGDDRADLAAVFGSRGIVKIYDGKMLFGQ